LQRLPSGVGALTALQSLRLQANQLKELPSSMCALTRLGVLDLGRNRLTSLPSWLAALSNLNTLNVFDNRIGMCSLVVCGACNLTCVASVDGWLERSHTPQRTARVIHQSRSEVAGRTRRVDEQLVGCALLGRVSACRMMGGDV
jgi:Leucine-rich repeat (LRR) protein